MSNNNINDNDNIDNNDMITENIDNNDMITENIDNNSDLTYINNTEYIFNESIMNDLQENVIPMLYQYDDTREDFYKYMIIKLSSLGYSLEDIYNAIGFYLEYIVLTDEMDIVRTQIMNFHRTEMTDNNNSIFNSLFDYNMYNILLNFMNNTQNNIQNNNEIELESVKLVVEKDELDNIKTCKYKELDEDIKNANPKCIICQSDFNKLNKVRILKCNHVYHNKCIDKWLTKISYKCPICREGCANYKPLVD
jgi:hypothetical protein